MMKLLGGQSMSQVILPPATLTRPSPHYFHTVKISAVALIKMVCTLLSRLNHTERIF